MNFLPQKDEFFDLLEQLSRHMVTVAQQLQEMPRRYPNHAALVERINAEEQAAEALTLSELKKLDSAFITPIDREDIMRLMSALYGVVESMTSVASSLDSYQFSHVPESLQEQLGSLQRLVEGTGDLVKPLRDGHKLSDLEDELRSVRRLKKEADQARHASLSHIFARNTDAIEAIKWVDLEHQLHTVVDRCDTVRATLQEVVLKNS